MAVAAAEKEAKLRESFVVVPPGDEAKTVVCPICKEALKSEFLEDDEEWVWKNAKEVKGKVCRRPVRDDIVRLILHMNRFITQPVTPTH
jgi:hypothetical protein